MRVALFGGTGYVGSYLVDALVAAGHEPSLLVRPGSESRVRHPERGRQVAGDILDTAAICRTLEDCEAAIYNIGILRENPARGVTYEAMHYEGARRVMDAAPGEGAKRFLLMSANGVKPDGTGYQRTKYQAERHLETVGLDWTVFRPSVQFGDPRGRMEFATQLYNDIVRSPLPAPLFFDGLSPFEAGRFQMAPVSVRDVAQAFVRSLSEPATVGRRYTLCGPQTLEWRQIIDTIAQAAGRSKLAVPVPAWALRPAAAVLERFEAFPITRDQIDMLLEGNTCDDGMQAFEELGIEPQPFDAQALSYLTDDAAP